MASLINRAPARDERTDRQTDRISITVRHFA